MTPAGPLLLSVISSLLWLTWGFDPAPSACSALASGVLYGSFSLKDLFPTIATGCSWTLENPDPTKYSLYLKFNREEQVCTHFSPMVLPLDHYLANYTCGPQGDAGPPPRGQEDGEEEGEARVELCQGASPITFLHFDKNFVQLCLAAEPEAAPRLLAPDALEFRFVEVLLINNNNSSQFTCGVLCRWFEECLRLGERGARRCGLTQAGCSCQAEVPPVPRQNETLSNALPPAGAPAATSSSQCCVTELHSGNANDLYAPEIKYGSSLAGIAGDSLGLGSALTARTTEMLQPGLSWGASTWCPDQSALLVGSAAGFGTRLDWHIAGHWHVVPLPPSHAWPEPPVCDPVLPCHAAQRPLCCTEPMDGSAFPPF